MRRVLILSAIVSGMTLAACGDGGEVAEIPFSEVRQAKDGGPEALEIYFRTIQGKRVRWTGRVRDAMSIMGDHFMEQGFLLVDMDADGQGSEAADVNLHIPANSVDAFKPGDPVTYVATITYLDRMSEGAFLRLDSEELVQ